MNYENVHDVYDVILKIILLIWLDFFLKFIGIDEEIKEVLKTEFVAVYGRKAYVDYLCKLKNNSLLHIEFEFPVAYNSDLKRYYFYNSIIRIYYEGDVETLVFNFTSKRNHLVGEIGHSISFHPLSFYLGDVDFDNFLE